MNYWPVHDLGLIVINLCAWFVSLCSICVLLSFTFLLFTRLFYFISNFCFSFFDLTLIKVKFKTDFIIHKIIFVQSNVIFFSFYGKLFNDFKYILKQVKFKVQGICDWLVHWCCRSSHYHPLTPPRFDFYQLLGNHLVLIRASFGYIIW